MYRRSIIWRRYSHRSDISGPLRRLSGGRSIVAIDRDAPIPRRVRRS
jgi:hypothetical protein